MNLLIAYRKYAFLIFIFVVFQVSVYLKGITNRIILSHLNFIIYFFTYLIILENYKRTRLNKEIIRTFKYFYFYLSVVISLSVLFTFFNKHLYVSVYRYTQIGLNLFLFYISLLIFLYSFHFNIKNFRSRLFVFLISLVTIILFYYDFIFAPLQMDRMKNLSDLFLINYLVNFISLFLLMIFWFRYYKGYLVLTEFLNIVIFLFMVSILLDTIYYLFREFKIEVFIHSQYTSLALNILMLVAWYLRYVYLNQDISAENERYLENYDYLKNLVPKPRSGLFEKILRQISQHLSVSILVIFSVGFALIYFVNRISSFLLLNTILILFVILLSIFFGILIIKRHWRKQMGFIFARRSKEK